MSQGSVLLRSSYSSHSLAIIVLFFIKVVCWVKGFTKLRLRTADSERQLGHMRSVAYIDGLTRLRNRYAWAEWEEGVDRRMDSGEQATFGVCVCDLNDLKRVNDSLGHVAGDAYIQAASRRICKAFEHSPVLCTGGDEFVVFLQGEDLARHEELMRMLEDMPAPEGEPAPVIASGFSVVCADDHSLRPVFERADERMYERKLYLKSRR